MRSQSVVAVVVMAAILVAASVAGADSYTGSLSNACIVTGEAGAWAGYSTFTMGWAVTNEDGGAPATHPWKYTYHFSFELGEDEWQGGISHLILELSDSFVESNLTGLTTDHDFKEVEIGTFGDQGASNPEIPENIYGIKFDLDDDDDNETNVLNWSFYSDRAPVWGDFYTKDGRAGGADNYAYNSGFGSPDSDPLAPPADDSLLCHILVPDTFSDTPGDPGDPGNPAAEPSALALMVLSGLGLTTRRRRS
jgi:hypothetical protein